MPASPARSAAFDILLRVEREQAYAPELLNSPRFAGLSAADHGLATELVMGVLRWRSRLDQQIAPHASQPLARLDLEVLTALRLAAYQLAFLERVPSRAAVHESVELVKRARKRSAAPFANAVLRKLAQEPRIKGALDNVREPPELAALSAFYAHPPWLVDRWAKQFGSEITRQICRFDQMVPHTTIRLRDPSAEADLRKEGIELAPGALLASARQVRTGDVTRTRVFAEERVVIQDEASQLVALLVGRGASILDCCAAPGGKTRLLADRNPGATIMAAELHPHRARLLRKLVSTENVQVVSADARQLPLNATFDRVLADAPCSGTGTLARHPEIKWRLKPEDLADLHARQAAILRAAMERVAPGGRLVYSTCSLEDEENSQVVEEVLAGSSFRLLNCRDELKRLCEEGELLNGDLDALVAGPYLRTLPGMWPCDGFFAAILALHS